MIKKLLLAIIATLALVNPAFSAQHDYDITTIDADSGVAMRAAINSALQSLASNNLGATAPTSPYAGMLWADTTTGYLKQRSTDNLSWITKGLIADTWQKLDGELTAISGLTSAADTMPYFIGPGTAALATLTTSGRNLIDDASTTAQRTTLGLGTAATAAVTTSATDTTASRLLKVGDFGLGGTAAQAAIDFDTLPESAYVNSGTGFATILALNTSTNGPVAGQNFYVQHIFYTGGNCVQTAYPYNMATGSMWQRTRNSSVWSDWYKIYDQSNINGTVSGTYAAPTGAIIETGTNANGRYTKFADGTMICTHSLTTATQVMTATSGWYRTIGDTWTFPEAFAAAPNVHTAVDGYLMFASQGVPTTSAVVAFALSLTPEPYTKTLRLTAIGRWM